ncbi:MAG: hypothetical protein QY307_06160 [Acidimicrobiia bacterium]|nr:MAG: hypothetical protein QY307_06160 [Acidimicrobiia bacterium]
MIRRLRERTKATLDRRYATLEQAEELLSALRAEVDDARADLESLRAEVGSLMAGIEGLARKGSDFIAAENPHEMRKKLFEAHRLAVESGRAIELILQTEVLMWQEIDRVAATIGLETDPISRLV